MLTWLAHWLDRKLTNNLIAHADEIAELVTRRQQRRARGNPTQRRSPMKGP